jgi:hypothetical protein
MPSESTNILNFVGTTVDPTQIANPDNNNASFMLGRQTDTLVSEIHGQYWTANYRGKLFQASTTIVTFPVVTASLASVFTLYNPPGVNTVAEIVYSTLTMQAATGVVNTIGWYFSGPPQGGAGTFTTKGTVNSGRLGAPTNNNVLFYTSYTHSGTPVLGDVIGGFGATTNTTTLFPFKAHNGSLMLYPGTAMSLAMSTAAGATTGWGAEVKWVEWPA